MTRFHWLYALLSLALTAVVDPAVAYAGATLRLRYDDVDRNGPNGGAWYKDSNNEKSALAWGESYVMTSYVVMYRATHDQRYLDRLCEHADGVLAQRDSERGVVDYRGRSEPCWRATDYTTEPYCWAVHTGMIAAPMVELAVEVAADPALAQRTTYDGATFADKAARYVEAGKAAAAVHDDEWRDQGADSGYYIFRPDMFFYEFAGDSVPLNMMNALGILHLALYDATGDPLHGDRARRLANHFMSNLEVSPAGGYRWNYWGGAYAAPGEDVSHAAINVAFAMRAKDSGVVFNDAHLARFAKTFFEQVYVDSATSYDFVGGSGAQNNPNYRPQLGRWTPLARYNPSVHAIVRDLYAEYTTITSGSVLLGMAYLVSTDLYLRPFDFYQIDWEDLGGRRRATAYGANMLTLPRDVAEPQLVELHYTASRRTEVQQYDGVQYETVIALAPTGGQTRTAHVAYHPELHYGYGGEDALFQFTDEYVAGQGITLDEPAPMVPPMLTSKPPTRAEVGDTISYAPEVSGDGPMLWLATGPASEAWSTEPPVVAHRAVAPGVLTFRVFVENDYGFDEQEWSVEVSAPPGSYRSGVTEDGADGGAACALHPPSRNGSAAAAFAVAVALLWRRRRQHPDGERSTDEKKPKTSWRSS